MDRIILFSFYATFWTWDRIHTLFQRTFFVYFTMEYHIAFLAVRFSMQKNQMFFCFLISNEEATNLAKEEFHLFSSFRLEIKAFY